MANTKCERIKSLAFSEGASIYAMPRPSLGNRKQIAGRLPLEVYEAFEAQRALLGLGQNEALIVALKQWSAGKPPEPSAPDPPRPRPKSGGVVVAKRAVRGFHPVTGEPIYG